MQRKKKRITNAFQVSDLGNWNSSSIIHQDRKSRQQLWWQEDDGFNLFNVESLTPRTAVPGTQ
jgi:hypothetical protein